MVMETTSSLSGTEEFKLGSTSHANLLNGTFLYGVVGINSGVTGIWRLSEVCSFAHFFLLIMSIKFRLVYRVVSPWVVEMSPSVVVAIVVEVVAVEVVAVEVVVVTSSLFSHRIDGISLRFDSGIKHPCDESK